MKGLLSFGYVFFSYEPFGKKNFIADTRYEIDIHALYHSFRYRSLHLKHTHHHIDTHIFHHISPLLHLSLCHIGYSLVFWVKESILWLAQVLLAGPLSKWVVWDHEEPASSL